MTVFLSLLHYSTLLFWFRTNYTRKYFLWKQNKCQCPFNLFLPKGDNFLLCKYPLIFRAIRSGIPCYQVVITETSSAGQWSLLVFCPSLPILRGQDKPRKHQLCERKKRKWSSFFGGWWLRSAYCGQTKVCSGPQMWQWEVSRNVVTGSPLWNTHVSD